MFYTIENNQKTTMTRKEFIKYSLVIFITLVGVTGFIKSLNDLDIIRSTKPKKVFGSGPYGL